MKESPESKKNNVNFERALELHILKENKDNHDNESVSEGLLLSSDSEEASFNISNPWIVKTRQKENANVEYWDVLD
jgi:hypothetical protein